MAFYIQTQSWPRARYTMGDHFRPYRTIEEAQAAVDELRHIGTTIPIRIVNDRLEVQKRLEKCSA